MEHRSLNIMYRKPGNKKKDKKKDNLTDEERQQQEISRIKLPRGNQTLGILEQRLGASRVRVRCLDGKTRICRIPGRLKRRLWVRENDILIAEPWEFSGDSKGDILYKYTPTQVVFLKKKGYLKKIEMEEF
jgi:translation initiation factor 1A|tara:strand:+ start:782 stop:1174 length:393 start_codon:yes stop_codon:yes gene_type:complete